MRPDQRKAGGAVARAGSANDSKQSTQIIAPMFNVGHCIGCGARIHLVGGATSCGPCGAWRRWYSAHRIAVAASGGVS